MSQQKNKKLHFPKDFLWGASVSTHQVEGGNHNQWSVWELETAKLKASKAEARYSQLAVWPEIQKQATDPSSYVSAQASDHFRRYESDFDIAKSLHFNTLRAGIEWSRIEPKEGEFNEQALEHYKTYFKELKNRGITPVITLWHWTFPEWFAHKGGFKNRRNVKYFTRYVTYLTKQMGEQFEYVITLNEPGTYAGMSYHERVWPPQEGSKLALVWVLLNLAHAHRKSYKIIKKQQPRAMVGLAHNCTYFYAGDDSWVSRLSARVANYFANDFFIGRVKRQQDYLGVNYYWAQRMLGLKIHNPEDKHNDLGWDMQPDKLQPLVEQLYQKYQLPIMITESGVADMHDQYRQWWIAQSIKALDGVLADGVPVIGYVHWSLLDNFEWAEGFWPRFGLVEVDYKTQKRTVRDSAKWYGRFIHTLQNNV